MSLINFVYFCDRTASVKLPFLYTSNMNTTSKSTIRRATNYMYVKKNSCFAMQNDKKFFKCTIRNAIYYICYKTFLLCCIAKKALYIQAKISVIYVDMCVMQYYCAFIVE